LIVHFSMLIPFPDRDTRWWFEGNFVHRAVLRGLLLGVCVSICGCTSIFTQPVMSSTPQPLQWFSNLASVPVEATQPFDLTLIQPGSTTGIQTNDLLEITIWDLYEPGKPHSFPARVGIDGKIALPHLDPVAVVGTSASEVEAQLTASYRERDVLKQPRILVRELPSAPLHVYVTGSVLRPGLINLPRRNASVFAALVSAGGLSRNAGMHVFVSDQGDGKPSQAEQAAAPAEETAPRELPLVAGNSGLQLSPVQAPEKVQPSGTRKVKAGRAAEPVLRFQSEPPPQSETDLDLGPEEFPASRYSAVDSEIQDLEERSAFLDALEAQETGAADPEVDNGRARRAKRSVNDQPSRENRPNQETNPPVIEESIATRPTQASLDTQHRPGTWYDLSAERDRERLKTLVLREGDVITVRPAAPPVRITGAVAQPGPYRTPASNSLTLMEAVELAGGLSVRDKPVTVTLTRPASADRGIQRWTLRMGGGEPISSNAPFVQPGDLVHVEPTAKARVQSVVDAFRPSKW
jgi:protein involved in polysaccharide export with SLBB domain